MELWTNGAYYKSLKIRVPRDQVPGAEDKIHELQPKAKKWHKETNVHIRSLLYLLDKLLGLLKEIEQTNQGTVDIAKEILGK